MIDIMHIRLEDYYAVIPKTMIFNLYFFFEGVIGSLNLINVLNICPRKQKYPNNFPNIANNFKLFMKPLKSLSELWV